MKTFIMSDLHGNLAAFRAVCDAIQNTSGVEACILLGDLIDYGMHSNEIIKELQALPFQVLCNIWGNHEQAVMTDCYSRFSSERGRRCARYTKSVLTPESLRYMAEEMSSSGCYEFEVNGKRCLAVHGSMEDPYWLGLRPEHELPGYDRYDYVFSGHTHLPHFFDRYYKTEDVRMRNRKRTVFINPGSVGQPRNHNNYAQYALFDFEKEDVIFQKVCYNIGQEQQAYHGEVDEFYKKRLELGI